MRLTKKVVRLLERERVCRVATVGADGTPHLVPVCHVLWSKKLYFGSGKGPKVANIRRNPQVAVTVDLYTDEWTYLRGVMVQGRARIIERGPRFRKIRSVLYRKFPQYRTDAALDESNSVVVEVTPTHVFPWGED